MSGRGKAATLPSWLTNGNEQQPAIGVDSNEQQYQMLNSSNISFIQPQPISNIHQSSSSNNSLGNYKPSLPPNFSVSPQNNVNTWPPSFNPISVIPPQFNFPPVTTGVGGFPLQQPLMPPRLPVSLPLPVQSSMAPPASKAKAIDPNNDVSAWSEHNTEDGRKYWFNRLLGTSTFDKPFCLKTPEERSIPPCPWKEYSTPEGKKYYSDGTESLWTMPDEYRIWKERMDAIEAKRAAAIITAETNKHLGKTDDSNLLSQSGARNNSNNNTNNSNSLNSSVKDITDDNLKPSKQSKIITESEDDQPIYLTKEEAKQAFVSLLNEKQIGSSLRLKEVQDICEGDKRWNALKGGERKQELAEYQTKKLKIEKEIQKTKSRKNRDAFLLMLAENIEIDARTRWSEAIDLLQHDNRYKAVEDAREREELFIDFVKELEKKEREDRTKRRTEAAKKLTTKLETLSSVGKITRHSLWSDYKAECIEMVLKDPELRSLDDADARRVFQDHIQQLETDFRQMRRQRRVDMQKSLDLKLIQFREYLEKLIKEGILGVGIRWKEFVETLHIKGNELYKEICDLLSGNGDRDMTAETLGLNGTPRDVFNALQDMVASACKADKTLIRNIMDEYKLKVEPKTQFSDFKNVIFKIAGVKESSISVSGPEPKLQYVEEGEDIDAGSDGRSAFDVSAYPSHFNAKNFVQYLRLMLFNRPKSLEQIYNMLLLETIEIQREEERKVKKREDRFIELLEEFFYRSDHVGISWDVAKRDLEGHRAYHDMDREDRKRLFTVYMDDLRRKLETKTKSMYEDISDTYNGRDLTEKKPVNTNDKISRSEDSKRPHETSREESDELLKNFVESDDSDDSASSGSDKPKHKKAKKEKKSHKKRKKDSSEEKSGRPKKHPK